MYQPKDLEGLLRLFTFDNKRELKKYARNLVIHQSDLVALIRTCRAGGGPFAYAACFPERAPSHLTPDVAKLR
jgi:hypothetical protein